MSSQTFSNISSETGATSPSGNPAHYGRMQYVPYFGSNGVFVVMGGVDRNGLIGLGYVRVFDPASGSWYNQTTTGSEPAPRYSFCTAGIASTNDTYEIFVYAGDSGYVGDASVLLDTVNILSLPGFNWISVAYNPQYARTAHTCEAVGGSQIAIVGGYDADPPSNNVTTANAVSRSEFSTPDPFAQGLAIFDLQTLDFAAEYVAGGGAVYEPNEAITQFYAQGSYSGNLLEGVAQLMREKHFPPGTSSNSTASNSTLIPPSSSSSSNSPHTDYAGAIASGVIGGLVGIALIIVLVLLRRRRRRMQAQRSRNPARDDAGNELWAPKIDGNARAELQQPVSRLELGHGEAHETDGNARAELPG